MDMKTFYSEEREGYVATYPSFPQLSSFGKTEEDAIKGLGIIVELYKITGRKSQEEKKEEKGQKRRAAKKMNEKLSVGLERSILIRRHKDGLLD